MALLSSLERAQEQDQTGGAPGIFPSKTTRLQAFYTVLYEQVNQWTGGHAAPVMRLASFLIVGGLGTVVNLGCVFFFSRYTVLPYALYVVLATEISLLFNFALNDRFTFRALVDGRRNWWVRCARFHLPAMLGFFLTLLISDVAHYVGHLAPLWSQSIAIFIVTFVNFAVHHLWTYRIASPRQTADAPLL